MAEALIGCARRAAGAGLPGVPGHRAHDLPGASLRARPAPERVGHGEASADADDRSRPPPLARAADAAAGSGTCRSAAVRGDAGAALARLAAEGARLVVADAIDDGDLLRLGRAARGHRLVTGGSGILLGLPAQLRHRRRARGARGSPGAPGPGLVLAGSCSAATLRQVAAYARGHPTLRLGAEDALDTEATLARAIGFVEANREAAPMVTSSDGPEAVAAAQARHGGARLAALYEADLRAADGGGGGERVLPHRRGRRRDLRGGGGGAREGGVRDRAGDRPRRAGAGDDGRAAAGAGVEVGEFRRRRLPGAGARGCWRARGDRRGAGAAGRDVPAGGVAVRARADGGVVGEPVGAAAGRVPDDADEQLPGVSRGRPAVASSTLRARTCRAIRRRRRCRCTWRSMARGRRRAAWCTCIRPMPRRSPASWTPIPRTPSRRSHHML